MWGFVFSALTKAVETGVNYFGQRKAGELAKRQGEMERNLYGKNADLADQQADDAIARGEEAANRQTYRMRTTLGAQNAAFAGQGVSVLGGSPADVIGADQAIGEADRLAITENARREAWGYRQQADIYRQRGQMAYDAGINRRRAMNIASLGTLANFGGDMFSMYQGFRDGGGGGGKPVNDPDTRTAGDFL